MAAQPTGAIYEVIVWDYDAAPDAADYFSSDYTEEELKESILPYFCAKRRKFLNLAEAERFCWEQEDSPCCYVGAAVFQGNEWICGFGLNFGYQKEYF